MNIQRAKNEIIDSLQAYLLKDDFGDYVIPVKAQRPILLLGAPGIGKTQIMEQIAKECKCGLVAYTITHHTRQSAVELVPGSQTVRDKLDSQKGKSPDLQLRSQSGC